MGPKLLLIWLSWAMACCNNPDGAVLLWSNGMGGRAEMLLYDRPHKEAEELDSIVRDVNFYKFFDLILKTKAELQVIETTVDRHGAINLVLMSSKGEAGLVRLLPNALGVSIEDFWQAIEGQKRSSSMYRYLQPGKNYLCSAREHKELLCVDSQKSFAGPVRTYYSNFQREGFSHVELTLVKEIADITTVKINR